MTKADLAKLGAEVAKKLTALRFQGVDVKRITSNPLWPSIKEHLTPAEIKALTFQEGEPMPDDSELVAELRAQIAAKDAQIAELQAKISELEGSSEEATTENTALKEEVAAFKEQAKNKSWDEYKAKLPKGFVHADKEKESREKFETDPAGFSTEVMNFLAQNPNANMLASGSQTSSGEGGEPQNPNVTVGVWDPREKKYVNK